MISIFYSTRFSNKSISKRLQKSCTLKDVEVIEFVNDGSTSLAKAYNQAIEQSKYDILVCVHDDVYLERGWDVKILKYFENSDYGIIGLAGTTTMVKSGVWWEEKNLMLGRVFHPVYHNNQKTDRWHESQYCQRFPNQILQSVVVDGLFIALHKKRIKSKFDERFEGFHFYDIPFCVNNHLENVKIGTITDIIVKHDSIGMPNEQWYTNKALFETLYGQYLPLKIIPEVVADHSPVKLTKEPKLAIIIPTKDNFDYLNTCVLSILKTKYNNYKIYIADTGSSEDNFEQIKDLCKSVNEQFPDRINIVKYPYYHFAKINNSMVFDYIDTDTEVLLFCNDDICMVNDAISLTVQTYNKHEKHVGTIGCRLHYADNTIQHGGIALFHNKQNHIGLSHIGIRSYFKASYDKQYDTLGNTGAFLMIGKETFESLGAFNESVKECFEDVLLNFNCISHGLKNIYIGNAVCYHYESVTRNKNEEKKANEQSDFLNILVPYIQKNISHLRKYITHIG